MSMRMDDTAREIAAQAARLVAEEGLEYGPAKRRALRQMGLPPRTALPDNDLVEEEVRDYLALFQADTQPRELRALRETALSWMDRLATFRPHLGGAVWSGTATRLSDIYLHLFCDDPKSAELALIDHGVDYEVREGTSLRGARIDILSVHVRIQALGEEVGLHLLIEDLDELRGALKPDGRGRVLRGPASAVRAMLCENGSP